MESHFEKRGMFAENHRHCERTSVLRDMSREQKSALKEFRAMPLLGLFFRRRNAESGCIVGKYSANMGWHELASYSMIFRIKWRFCDDCWRSDLLKYRQQTNWDLENRLLLACLSQLKCNSSLDLVVFRSLVALTIGTHAGLFPKSSLLNTRDIFRWEIHVENVLANAEVWNLLGLNSSLMQRFGWHRACSAISWAWLQSILACRTFGR